MTLPLGDVKVECPLLIVCRAANEGVIFLF